MSQEYDAYPLWKFSMSLKEANLTLRGSSRAGVKSCFYIPELKIMLDAGMGCYFNPRHILITHCHSDHSFMLPMILTGIEKKVKVYVPDQKELYENFISATAKLTTEDIEGNFGGFFISNINSQETIETNKFRVEIFDCSHRVISIGYGITLKNRKRLKAEYKNLTGKEIGSLHKSGVEVNETFDYPALIYLGDTTIEVLQNLNNIERGIFNYKYIMIECTYLMDADLKNAQERGHIVYSQLKPFIVSHPENIFILYHFSLKHSTKMIDDFFAKEDLKNIIPWTN